MFELMYEGSRIVNICSEIELFNRFAKNSIVDKNGDEWVAVGRFVMCNELKYMIYRRVSDGNESIIPIILKDTEKINISEEPKLLLENGTVKYTRCVYYYESVPMQSVIVDGVEWFPSMMMGLCSNGKYNLVYFDKSGNINIFSNDKKEVQDEESDY
jgi:hypothetical protein